MFEGHAEFIGLIVAYTFLGAFIFTVLITCLSLVGIVKFADQSQQRKLFGILIVELVVVCLGFFSNFLTFSPERGVEATIKTAVREKGLVWIQIPSEQLRPLGRKLQSAAIEAGFVAPAVEVVPPHKAPNSNQIRYFYPEQARSAEELGSALSQVGASNFSLQYLSGFEGKVPQTQNVLEVWLASQ